MTVYSVVGDGAGEIRPTWTNKLLISIKERGSYFFSFGKPYSM